MIGSLKVEQFKRTKSMAFGLDLIFKKINNWSITDSILTEYNSAVLASTLTQVLQSHTVSRFRAFS